MLLCALATIRTGALVSPLALRGKRAVPDRVEHGRSDSPDRIGSEPLSPHSPKLTITALPKAFFATKPLMRG